MAGTTVVTNPAVFDFDGLMEIMTPIDNHLNQRILQFEKSAEGGSGEAENESERLSRSVDSGSHKHRHPSSTARRSGRTESASVQGLFTLSVCFS